VTGASSDIAAAATRIEQTNPASSKGDNKKDSIQAVPDNGGSLADLAKKLSSWKDGLLGDPVKSAGGQLDDGANEAGVTASGQSENGPTATKDNNTGSATNSTAPVSTVPTVLDTSFPTPPVSPGVPSFPVAGAVSGGAASESVSQKQPVGPVSVSDAKPVEKTSEKTVSAPGATSFEKSPSVPASSDQTLMTSPGDVNPKANEPTFGAFKAPLQQKKDASLPPSVKRSGGYPHTIEELMELVVDKSASDLHVGVGYPAMVRLDGALSPVGQDIIGEEDIADLVLPVLPENKRELLEVNREVDLAYSFKQDARFRINAFYTKGSIAGAFRLIPNRIRTIEELKLPGVYHQLTKLPQGLVLVTGPTGHGKSTTLAAMLQEVNETYPKHIITIEDPIEYVYPKARALVNQREMHEDPHSWEIALRSAMREDPDVILVGEMRDFETIAAAITLAETGHLVFATLHTNSSSQTLDRIIDVFPEHQQAQVRTQVSNVLEAIISQRLVPISTGGRRAVSEVLLATGAVRNLIREGKSHQIDNVIRTSLDIGMKTLEHSLVDLVREGAITVDEAESIALHPEEVIRLMRG
jgi:twitching motility protein PilT